jgi:hypothetical protein
MVLRRLEFPLLGACALLLGACGSTRTSIAAGEPDTPRPPPVVVATDDAFTFAPDGRTLAVYDRGTRGLKPYLKSLVGEGGVELIRDEPAGHEHHHGLMLAVGVDDVDFWGERYAEVPGREVERSSLTFGVRASQASELEIPIGDRDGFGESIEWLDPRDASVRLVEHRTLDLAARSQNEPWLFTWTSRLVAPESRERVRLWGRAYFGLGLRLAEPFDRVARFTHSDARSGATQSEVVRGDERLTAGRWCAVQAEVAGRARTLALFASPANARAARFFTMAEPFAYLSATLDLAREPLEIERGAPLELTWALAVWDRAPTPAEIEACYAAWSARIVAPGGKPTDWIESLESKR